MAFLAFRHRYPVFLNKQNSGSRRPVSEALGYFPVPHWFPRYRLQAGDFGIPENLEGFLEGQDGIKHQPCQKLKGQLWPEDGFIPIFPFFRRP